MRLPLFASARDFQVPQRPLPPGVGAELRRRAFGGMHAVGETGAVENQWG